MKLTRLSLVSLVILWAANGYAEPFVPDSDDQVLQEINFSTAELPPAELRQMTRQLQKDSQNLVLALEVAKQYISIAKASRDPRFYGFAEQAISPWWNSDVYEVMPIKADILQFEHKFSEAVNTLEAYLLVNPSDLSQHLNLATILLVSGKFKKSLDRCLVLLGASPIYGTACKAMANANLGNLAASYEVLLQISKNQRIDDSLRLWVLSNAGEMAERLGADSAESLYKQALAIAPSDTLTLSFLFDLYSRQNRWGEGYSLLEEHTENDALLVRSAIAAKMLKKSNAETLREKIAANFESVRQRGTPVHQREEALYFLYLDPKPKRAVELAWENFELQKEPLDSLILAMAASSVDEKDRLRNLREFVKQNQYEDIRLDKYLGNK